MLFWLPVPLGFGSGCLRVVVNTGFCVIGLRVVVLRVVERVVGLRVLGRAVVLRVVGRVKGLRVVRRVVGRVVGLAVVAGAADEDGLRVVVGERRVVVRRVVDALRVVVLLVVGFLVGRVAGFCGRTTVSDRLDSLIM